MILTRRSFNDINLFIPIKVSELSFIFLLCPIEHVGSLPNSVNIVLHVVSTITRAAVIAEVGDSESLEAAVNN